MKKLLILVAVLCPFSLFGQMSSTGAITASGSTCGTTNACIPLTLFNSPSISTTSASVVVTGTFSGTLQFEASTDGVTFSSIPGIPLAGGASVTSATSTGTWTFGIAALAQFRVRASAFASGSATVTIQASGGGSASSAAAIAALFGGPGTSSQFLAANGTIQSVAVVPSVASCATTTTCSNTAVVAPRFVRGTVPLTAGAATVTGISPAFTSTATFNCTATDTTAAAAVSVAMTSASSITFAGTSTDTISYLCVGN